MLRVAAHGARTPVNQLHNHCIELGVMEDLLSHAREVSERRKGDAPTYRPHFPYPGAVQTYRSGQRRGTEALARCSDPETQ